MFETLIGLCLLGGLIYLAYFLSKKSAVVIAPLSTWEKLLLALKEMEGFNFNEATMMLKKSNLDPEAYAGFALDDAARKMMCFNGEPGQICDYSQILEWRLLVNNKTIACLSLLSSSVLQVQEPDKNLNLEEFLKSYCGDTRPEPSVDSVHMKFLIRNLHAPVHMFSVKAIDQGAADAEVALSEALTWIDKFKIVMYRNT